LSACKLKRIPNVSWSFYLYSIKENCVRNLSVNLSLIFVRNEKIEYYIRIKTYKPIALRFWVERGVNALCGWD